MGIGCTEARKELELYVLGGVGELRAGQIEDHLARCLACRRLERDCRRVLAELKAQAETGQGTDLLFRRVCRTAEPSLRKARMGARFRRFALAASSVAAVLVLAASGWHVWAHRNRGRASTFAGQSVLASGPLRTIWQSANAGGTGIADADTVVAENGMVFFLSEDGGEHNVNAVDAASGKTLWRSGVPSCGYLATDEQRLYCVGSASKPGVELVALGKHSGQVVWTFGTPETSNVAYGLSKPTITPDNRIFWVCESSVYALDGQAGEQLWRRAFDGEGCISRAAVSGRDVYVAGRNGIYCMDGESGQLRWHVQYRFYTWPGIKPLIAATKPGRLFVAAGSKDGRSWVRCIDTATRRCLWERLVPKVSHLCADAHHVYLRCQHVLALDRNTGEPVWEVEATGCSPITAYDGILCFVDRTQQGRLVAVGCETGRTAWQVPGLGSCNGFVKVGQRGYLKIDGSVVLAFALGS